MTKSVISFQNKTYEKITNTGPCYNTCLSKWQSV